MGIIHGLVVRQIGTGIGVYGVAMAYLIDLVVIYVYLDQNDTFFGQSHKDELRPHGGSKYELRSSDRQQYYLDRLFLSGA